MSDSIIGFGKIGQALAKAFARKDIDVAVATTRDPASFASAAAALGPTIHPAKLAEAVEADDARGGRPEQAREPIGRWRDALAVRGRRLDGLLLGS